MSSLVSFPQQYRPFPPSPTYSRTGSQHRNIPPRLEFDIFDRKPFDTPSHSGGLRTPPADDSMGAAYRHPVAVGSTYDAHLSLARHSSVALPSAHLKGSLANTATLLDPPVKPYSRSQSYAPTASQLVTSQALKSQPSSAASRASTQVSSVTSNRSSSSDSTESTIFGDDSIMVKHSLKLPPCISPGGGSVDGFAAWMTCFFWFETMETIQVAETIKMKVPTGPLAPLAPLTTPCDAYKKWVANVLSTTQVTQNVVFLALLFVYRLKKTNPRVHGESGSEYRLLTVALMLGNKFLDDNTYTNKTWAEVSGLSVQEIHVMEVEFLSNMRYSLLTSKEEWKLWIYKLSCFYEYCARARVVTAARQTQLASLQQSPPLLAEERVSPSLPSPTTMLPSTFIMHGTPSRAAAYSPVSPHTNWDNVYNSTPTISPLTARIGLASVGSRKRSVEGCDAIEPSPKRVARPQNIMMPASITSMPSGAEYSSVRLPAPQLALDINQALPSNGSGPSSSYQYQTMTPLPPIKHGMRAMSTVYTTPTSSAWSQHDRVLPTCGPQTPSFAVPHYGTPTKRHSPSSMSGFGSSPLSEVYATLTPIANSPSIYLQQRPSPYKPVRRVNTLLNPPPSIPLSEYHLGSSQMHYHTVGRRSDPRSGIVPDFLPPSQRHANAPYQ